ncbi:MAG: 30S ribosomal protein S8, partial [Elusimicrobiota bacterium]|nr:30S ribosomal protein S8 [Elusimicrobiota bacterium]
MVVTDTVADMICRINNALMRKKSETDVPLSKVKQEIARLLKEEGYIANYEVIENKVQGTLRISLKYTPSGDSVIRDLKRISRPGKRQYVNVGEIPKVIEGLGRAVISTSRGL